MHTMKKCLGKAAFQCSSDVFQRVILGFENLSPQSAGEKVQILLFEEKSTGASVQPQRTLGPAHSGYHFPFCIRTIRFTTCEEHLEGRCSTGTRQTCSIPFLSSCDSPTDLPTVEGRTIYCKNDTDFPLKALLRPCLQTTSSELLFIISCLEKFGLLCNRVSLKRWPLPFLPFLFQLMPKH